MDEGTRILIRLALVVFIVVMTLIAFDLIEMNTFIQHLAGH